MSNRRKERVRILLKDRDLRGVEQWARRQPRSLNAFFSFTYDSDDLIKWRAVEAIGKAAQVKHPEKTEQLRDFIRRLIWLMNDESGGLGWHAPEVIGEILVNVPALIPEYAGLLPHYITEEPFERGALLAIARVGQLEPTLIHEHNTTLVNQLTNPDAVQAVFALMALDAGGCPPPPSTYNIVETSQLPITLYDFHKGTLVSTTPAHICEGICQT